MNPLLRILVSIGLGAVVILSFIFFTTAGLFLAAFIGIWLLISRLKNGGKRRDQEQNSWFRVVTIRPDGNGGYVRTESGSAPSDTEIVDISPDNYREVEIEAEHNAIDVTPKNGEQR